MKYLKYILVGLLLIGLPLVAISHGPRVAPQSGLSSCADCSASFEPAGAIATHIADTTAIHGIADTSVLTDKGANETVTGYWWHLVWRLTPATGALGSIATGDLLRDDGTYDPFGASLGIEGYGIKTSGGYSLMWDVTGKTYHGDFQLPYGDSLDTIAAPGYIVMDTDGWLRIYQNSIQKGMPIDEHISKTIIQPDDMDQADDVPLWCNFSGMSFEIHTIYAMADADDADFALVSCPYTDLTDETVIEAITVATDSTGVFTYTIGAGAGTDIDEGTIPTGECIVFDPSADDLEFVTVTILGYYLGDVD